MCKDASALGISAVLMQTEEGKCLHAIVYASHVLTSAKSKYSITHLEALAVVWALQHYRNIIFGYPVIFYTDHTVVTQLIHGKNLTGHLARWYLTIQQFEQMLSHATFQFLQSLRFQTFLHLSCARLNANTPCGPKSSMP